jgi:hypothetical protein
MTQNGSITKTLRTLREKREQTYKDMCCDDSAFKNALSNFMIDLVGRLGGGLPSDYFTDEQLDKIERIFRGVYFVYFVKTFD